MGWTKDSHLRLLIHKHRNVQTVHICIHIEADITGTRTHTRPCIVCEDSSFISVGITRIPPMTTLTPTQFFFIEITYFHEIEIPRVGIEKMVPTRTK